MSFECEKGCHSKKNVFKKVKGCPDNKNVVFILLMMGITCPRIDRGQREECAATGGVDNRWSGQQVEWTTGGVDNKRSGQQEEWTTGGVDNRLRIGTMDWNEP